MLILVNKRKGLNHQLWLTFNALSYYGCYQRTSKKFISCFLGNWQGKWKDLHNYPNLTFVNMSDRNTRWTKHAYLTLSSRCCVRSWMQGLQEPSGSRKALKGSHKMNKDLKQNGRESGKAMLPRGAEFPGQSTSLCWPWPRKAPPL